MLSVICRFLLLFQELGKYGLLFYNAMFMLFPAIVFADFSGELDEVRMHAFKSFVFQTTNYNLQGLFLRLVFISA